MSPTGAMLGSIFEVIVTTTDAQGHFKQDNYSTVGGDGVWAGTTSPMPDHKDF